MIKQKRISIKKRELLNKERKLIIKSFIDYTKKIGSTLGYYLSLLINIFLLFMMTAAAGVGLKDFIIWINLGIVGNTYATYASYIGAGVLFNWLYNSLNLKQTKEVDNDK